MLACELRIPKQMNEAHKSIAFVSSSLSSTAILFATKSLCKLGRIRPEVAGGLAA